MFHKELLPEAEAQLQTVLSAWSAGCASLALVVAGARFEGEVASFSANWA